MSGAGEQDFAALLQSLRIRSGRSYEDLARQTFTSRSTLHRYCTGAGLPVDDDVVLRLGEACGADPDELDDLVSRWKAAVAERDLLPAASAADGSAPPTPPAHAPAPPPLRRSRWARPAAVGVVAVAVAGGTAAVWLGGGDDEPAPADGDDVCITRTSPAPRTDGRSGAFDARWDVEQVCPNAPNVPVFLTPLAREDDVTQQAGTMYSTESWFVCWTSGRMHSGGGRIWYYTQGDVSNPDHRSRRAWGFVPSHYLDTAVDPDPGTPPCPA